MKKCTGCGATELEKRVEVERLTLDGVVFEKRVKVTACSRCAETFVNIEALAGFYLHVARQLVKVGVSGPQGFRHLRKAMELQSGELAELLGVTPETVSRWEKGKRSIETVYLKVLQMLARDFFKGTSTTRDVLRGPSRSVRPPHGHAVHP